MPARRQLTALALLIPIVLAALLASVAAGSGTTAPPSGRAAYFDRVREAVVQGAARDFAEGTGIGGPVYEACLKDELAAALDPPTISSIAAVYRRPGNSAFAAQILNAIALPLATRCGHRHLVPELTAAAAGFSFSHDTGAAVRALGVSYGPYLGVRCRKAGTRDCGRVGIDVVFRRPAAGVVAYIGGQKTRLVTPGRHNGVANHDWVGTFTHARFVPRGSFNVDDEPLYAAVELRVIFAGGRRAHALFPRVLVAPGWG
ncbi:MAG TPA: hypothetical protein VHA76_15885 [Solirubrobacterales bacterium]|nr:hypothetical protein [Solirubrobacterales bacterium]